MRNTSQDYIFGPVPSHRLGKSLGIDPFGSPANKTCTLDCIFCEVGSTRLQTTELIAGPDPDVLVQAVLDYLSANPIPDYITVSGSGEPTLWLGLETFLRRMRESVSIPLAVITNSTTLWRDEVRKALGFVHVVLPTLTTVDEENFIRIHAPLPGITAALCAGGIRRLRQEVPARIWLEVLLLRGINDDERGLSLLADAIRRINPHKVQITTLSRPGRLSQLVALKPEQLERACHVLAQSGVPTEIAAAYASTAQSASISEEQIVRIGAMLRLRWVSLADLARQLGMETTMLESMLADWFGDEKLDKKEQDGIIFVRLQANNRA
jgi:wyosine [tRNA(Phe)-imidazoG37] synthetase (radical SAM superfamily)